MVFVKPDYFVNTGLILVRTIGTDPIFLLILESLTGTIVAISNILVITRAFYVVVANIIIFTSLKAFVELGFILPYYIMRSDGKFSKFGYFTEEYEYVIFNLSVLADFGVLFFSVLIAVNRFRAVTRKTGVSTSPSWSTFFSCLLVWGCSVVIPLIFYLCKCQYTYYPEQKLYYNTCEKLLDLPRILNWVLNCLLYISYACTVVVLILYIIIAVFLRSRRRQNSWRSSSQSSVEIKLLKQTFVVFMLYALSILSVLILSFVPYEIISPHNVSYVENLLNLSIAAVYPICILSMSGEMKSVLTSKIAPSRYGKAASVTVNIHKS